MSGVRLSIVTFNLWNSERWPARAPALEKFLELFAPDVFCVQELTRETQAFIDRVLAGHARVHDPLPGWTTEGNVWWNASLLERVAHGAEEAPFAEPDRRLFWARLRLRATGRTLFVSTAHLTSPTLDPEPITGQSPRVPQLRAICASLKRLVQEGEPALFMGDMNDPRLPQRILGEIGFSSCFARLGLASPPTFYCYPTGGREPSMPTTTEACDLIAANARARVVAATVPNFYFDGMAVSDHWPVQAVYEVQ